MNIMDSKIADSPKKMANSEESARRIDHFIIATFSCLSGMSIWFNWGLFWDMTIAMKEIEDDLKDITIFSRF